ncbi:MAG: RidA family protein [Acidimicrobiales bacterium]
MREPVVGGWPDTPNRPYSQGIVAGGMIFVSGQVPSDADGATVGVGDPAAQTHQVIDRIADVVEAAGATLDDVVKITVYLADFADFGAVNGVFRERFSAPYPARASVTAGLVRPDFLIEMDAIAVVPAG